MNTSFTALGAFASLFTALPVAAAAASEPKHAEEVSIPFPETGIRSWHATDDRTLYVIDNRRRWYRVELMRPCVGLPYAYAIGFDTRGMRRIDRFSAITHEGQRCPVRSVVRSDGPPSTDRKPDA